MYACGHMKSSFGNDGSSSEPPLKTTATRTFATKHLRAAIVASVTTEDIFEIMFTLLEMAKKGNIAAAREVLDRTVGRPDESSIVKRLEEIEAAIENGTMEFKESA